METRIRARYNSVAAAAHHSPQGMAEPGNPRVLAPIVPRHQAEAGPKETASSKAVFQSVLPQNEIWAEGGCAQEVYNIIISRCISGFIVRGCRLKDAEDLMALGQHDAALMHLQKAIFLCPGGPYSDPENILPVPHERSPEVFVRASDPDLYIARGDAYLGAASYMVASMQNK